MGVEGTRRVQGPAPWAGEAGLNNAKPRPEEQPPRPANPSKARTPQEALTYIEQLYKSGRMEDLAALLRRSSVFRVAGLILQQSSPASLKATAVNDDSGNRGDTRGPVNLPVPYSSSLGWTVTSESGPAGFEVVKAGFAPEMSAPALAPRGDLGLLPVGKPNRLLIAALQAYQGQDRTYARQKETAPRLSLRV